MSEPAKPPSGSADPLSFDKVDLGRERKPTSCASCKQPITDTYFEVNGLVACPSCHDQLIAVRQGGSEAQRFARALLFGLGGAIAGFAIWMLVLQLTGYAIGLVAIVVGLLVGLAVKKGAGGGRGALYQGLAIVLTYVAIASANIPETMRDADMGRAGHHSMSSNAHSNRNVNDRSLSESDEPRDFAFWMNVIVQALKRPFTTATEHPIGLLILGFALYEAWKLNRSVPLKITGPLRVSLQRGAAPA